MIELARVYVAVSLIFLASALIFHIIAMSYDYWKVYEHRQNCNDTLFIGIFRRCETRLTFLTTDKPITHLICDDNKYCFHGNSKCQRPTPIPLSNVNLEDDAQKYCDQPGNPLDCDYSSITKGLISCTIIAACFLGLGLILIFVHIIINPFKYLIHQRITIVTLILLILGFLFLLITLILLGSTMSNDLYQYRYDLDSRVQNSTESEVAKSEFTEKVTNKAAADYDVRIAWSSGLEICALILSFFTIITQIIYFISIRRNRIG